VQDPLLIIALLACIVVLVILLLGINSFRKGDDGGKQSNKFMRWRLIAQFVAVVLIMVFVYVRGQSGG